MQETLIKHKLHIHISSFAVFMFIWYTFIIHRLEFHLYSDCPDLWNRTNIVLLRHVIKSDTGSRLLDAQILSYPQPTVDVE